MKAADKQSLQTRVRDLVEKPRVQNAIMILIVINAIILGLETVPEAMAAYGDILLAVDQFILGIFVIEVLLRIFAHRFAFTANICG